MLVNNNNKQQKFGSVWHLVGRFFVCVDLIQIKKKGLKVVFSEEGGFSKVSEDSIRFQGNTCMLASKETSF